MFASKRKGWIGIDIGTATVKIAQLVQSRGKVELGGLAIVSRHEAWPAESLTDLQPVSSSNEIIAAASLHGNLRGTRAAATLPMALSDVHLLNLDLDTASETDHIVRQALEITTQRSANNLQFETWSCASSETDAARSQTNVLTASRDWTDQLCDDIVSAGWLCETVDGLPFALARAVDMVATPENRAPVAALDLGYGRATFSVISEGRPAYVRCLKACHLSRLLDAIIDELSVSREEAQLLLQDFGIASNTDDSSHMAAELVQEVIATPLSQLEQQIRRTLAHLQGQRRHFVPKEIYLFGGGATIKGLSSYLSKRLQIKTKPWQCDTLSSQKLSRERIPICLFGPAIALSALAWEEQ